MTARPVPALVILPGGRAGGPRSVPGAAPSRPLARRPLAVVRDAADLRAVPDEPDPQDRLDRHLRWSLHQVLAGLDFPVPRWRIIAEADAWGVSGPVRRLLTSLPEGSYAGVHTVVGEVRRARPSS
ncbi:hypothetical protein [Pseudonocardia spirodelae]|uniref:Uncharacterized protein n=1 Tax=Pseudonocardia spirodelae TaxID=3133431 RepID=A0ABU8T2F6_9PSEU